MEMINTNAPAFQPNQNQKVNVQEFASKYSSKKEVYGFLTTKVRAYLAGYENVSIYFL